MKVAKTVAAVRKWRQAPARTLVLVPTMGALHHGHVALIHHAKRLAGPRGLVAVSIFVNPTQFGPREDFSAYPRPLSRDLALCRKAGVDLVFTPAPEEMYPADKSVFVDEGSLSLTLCGKSRPGHFRGVCTVVAKLFNIIQPTVAVFGEKDWQQLAIIRRMTRDLDFPVKINGHPIVRESDRLATSSRNAYLSAEERALAPGIHAALTRAAALKTPAAILSRATREIEKIPGARVDYVSLIDAETLAPLQKTGRPARLAIAVFLGKTRLIDNIAVPLAS